MRILLHIPGYWQRETSGVLRPAVEAYLRHEALTAEQLATMRAYLRQWIAAPAWQGEGVEALRHAVDGITSQAALDAWIAKAVAEGVDPL